MSYPKTPAGDSQTQERIEWQQLTALEQTLLILLAADCTYTEIVQRVPKKGNPDQRYSEHYIAHKISNLYKKIGVRSKSGAVNWYHQYKLVEQVATTPVIGSRGEPATAPQAAVSPSARVDAPIGLVEMGVGAGIKVPAQPTLTRFLPSAHHLPNLLLAVWITFSLLFGGSLVWRELQTDFDPQSMAFDLDLGFLLSLAVGLFGLWQTRRLTGFTHPMLNRGLFALSIGALFWTLGQLLASVNELGDYGFINLTFFDLSDLLAYIPHNLCTLLGTWWITRSVGLPPWRHKVIAGGLIAWVLVNLTTGYFFYGWEIQYEQPLAKLLYDVYYPLSDSLAILLMTWCLRLLAAPQTSKPWAKAILTMRYLWGALFTLWLADLLFGLTTSLPATNILAYENTYGADLLYYTVFLLQGIALFYLPHPDATTAPPGPPVTPPLLHTIG